MKKDKRVDEYIAKAQPFAQPILKHLRGLVHKACPEVEETIKWGMPSFEYKGPMYGFAAFKKHCAVGFWKASLMKDPHGLLTKAQDEKTSMGNLGCIASLKDLPSDRIMLSYLKDAVRLNDEGIKVVKTVKPKKAFVVDIDLKASLSKNKKANACFTEFSESNKREYNDWILEAKTEVTKLKRIEQAVEWMSEGKPRNWKYMKKYQA